jgi:hypothetical protein
MAKHRDKRNELDDEGNQAFLLDVDYELDEDDFYEQFQPKKSRQHIKKSRDARRRIEEYWEERELASRLSEYYDQDS